MKTKITAEELKTLLDYDAMTGIFTWKVDRRLGIDGKGLLRAAAGSIAGRVDPTTGYLQVNIRGTRHLMHRLAVLHVTGEWPIGEVDHIDGNKANTAWSNLRDVPPSVNKQNLLRARCDSQTGFQGVTEYRCSKRNKRFMARIVASGKQRHLGYYATPEEAHQVYLKAKRQLHAGCTI